MYFDLPVHYIEPLFRPPSEANSLVLQVTNGCSWNQFSFCEMYTQPQKKFKPRLEAEVLAEKRTRPFRRHYWDLQEEPDEAGMPHQRFFGRREQ